jgi:hypothetical protein
MSWVWWGSSVIAALGRLKQDDLKFEVRLGCIVRSSLKRSTAGTKPTKQTK